MAPDEERTGISITQEDIDREAARREAASAAEEVGGVGTVNEDWRNYQTPISDFENPAGATDVGTVNDAWRQFQTPISDFSNPAGADFTPQPIALPAPPEVPKMAPSVEGARSVMDTAPGAIGQDLLSIAALPEPESGLLAGLSRMASGARDTLGKTWQGMKDVGGAVRGAAGLLQAPGTMGLGHGYAPQILETRLAPGVTMPVIGGGATTKQSAATPPPPSPQAGREEKKGLTTEATTPVEEKAEGARAPERTAGGAQAGARNVDPLLTEAIEHPGRIVSLPKDKGRDVFEALEELHAANRHQYATGLMVDKSGTHFFIRPTEYRHPTNVPVTTASANVIPEGGGRWWEPKGGGVEGLSPALAQAYSEQLKAQEQQRRQAEFESVAMRGAARDAFKRRDEIERAIAETRKEIETVRGRLTAMNSTANYEREAKELYRPSSKHTYQKAAYLRDRDVQKLLGLQEHLGNLEAARGQAERLGYDLVGRSQARASEAAVLERSGPRLALEAVTRRKDIIEEMARAESQARVGTALERAGEERAVAGALGPTGKEEREAQRDQERRLEKLIEIKEKQLAALNKMATEEKPIGERSEKKREEWSAYDALLARRAALDQELQGLTRDFERFIRREEAPAPAEAKGDGALSRRPEGWAEEDEGVLRERVGAFRAKHRRDPTEVEMRAAMQAIMAQRQKEGAGE